MDKRHKSFSDPLSPALRHISDLIHLRAVSDLLAPGNLSHPRHRANSQLQRANNSFKPTPLRGVVVTSSHPSVPASATLPQRRGLIQALGLQEQSQQSPSSAQAAAETCITHHATAIARSVGESSPASNSKQLSLRHQDQGQDLQLANAGRARASATRRTACPTS